MANLAVMASINHYLMGYDQLFLRAQQRLREVDVPELMEQAKRRIAEVDVAATTEQLGRGIAEIDVAEEWTKLQSASKRELAWKALVAYACFMVVYCTFYAIYNLYFHPLRHVPGPWLARSGLMWRMMNSLTGRWHTVLFNAHNHYGTVVRVSPNEVSFITPSSWKSIYGHTAAGKQKQLIKGQFYEVFAAGNETYCIGSERDPKIHTRMKKSLMSAFSTRALLEQEPIMVSVVDSFVSRIGQLGTGKSGLNFTKWFEMVSFDILGEMAFGESFHCVETGKTHFWCDLILEHIFFITVVENLCRYPLLVKLGRMFLPALTGGIKEKHASYSRDQVKKRLATKTSRKDLFTNLISQVESGAVTRAELTSHVSTIAIAGGETVSTSLAGTLYYLLTNPTSMKKLQAELRSAFSGLHEINAAETAKLEYLGAVIQESLRIFPPGSQGFPRLAPEGGSEIDGWWVPEGTEVYTSSWTASHSPEYWSEPFKFLPERWLDPDNADVKEAHQPFSLGPRACIGRNFAMVEMNLIVSKMLWAYDFELVDAEKTDWEGGCRMHVMWWKPELNIRISGMWAAGAKKVVRV